MSMVKTRKKILFVGSSGVVARKVLPVLSKEYDIVGLSRVRKDGAPYCSRHYIGDLLHEHETIFERIFNENQFDAIVWNAVRYFPGPLHQATRPTLHTEFDLAVALPLQCLQVALRHRFGAGSPFLLISSQLAFGRKSGWGSYSVMKHAQVILADYISDELAHQVLPRVIAPSSVPLIPDMVLARAFGEALEVGDKGRTLYIVDEHGVR